MQIVSVKAIPVAVRGEPGGGFTGARPRSPYQVKPPYRSIYSADNESLLVRLETDSGHVGWGEALAPVAPEIVQAIVEHLLAPVLLGADPRPILPLAGRLSGLMRERGHLAGHQADALAGVDIALWDLRGRILGQSVAEMLGGPFRTRVPTYVSGLPADTDAGRVALARDLVQSGVRRIKLHLGHGVDADAATFAAVRGVHPDLKLGLDVHWVYGLADAHRLGRALDGLGAWFLEAPIVPEDVEGHRELAFNLATAVAVGETFRNRYEVADWLRRRALDLCQPDIGRTGITEGMAIAGLCAAAAVPVAPHHSAALGIALAAGLHVSAAAEQLEAFEFQAGGFAAANAVLANPLEAEAGFMPLPDGPGLGITIDEAAVERFRLA